MWILGGVLSGAGALESWRSNLTPTFAHLCAAGGIILVLAFVGTALAAAKAGSRLPLLGMLLFFVGYLTLFFGVGAVVALLGFALYLLGVRRAEVVEPHALVLAVVLLLLALAVAIVADSQIAGIELALAASCAAGVGVMAAGSAFDGSTGSPGGDQSRARPRSA